MKTTITTDDNIVAATCSFYLVKDAPEGYIELFNGANKPFRSTKKQEVLDRVAEAKGCLTDDEHLFLVESRSKITRL